MIKLITSLVLLLFCLPSNAQPTTESSSVSFLTILQSGEANYKITNAKSLNSERHDYCPYVLEDGILFTSDRTLESVANRSDANFYFAASDDNGQLQAPTFYESAINSTSQDGMASISPDGKLIVFSRDVSDEATTKSGFSDVRLYIASWENEAWTNIEKMSINVEDYSSGHPAFSPSGDALYFVSNRPGGYGATDVYVSKLENDEWSKPRNLGPTINSSKSELFPFMDESGVLYFSSNRLGGYGLLDIYASELSKNKVWESPINLGLPFNSEKNDFGFYKMQNKNKGYLSTNRDGGEGGNDIFTWEALSELDPVENIVEVFTSKGTQCVRVIGQLIASDDATPIDIEDARVMITNLTIKKDQEIYTKEGGRFEICLPCESEFMISVFPEDYYMNNTIVSTKGVNCSPLENVNVEIAITPIAAEDVTMSGSNMNNLDDQNQLSEEDLAKRNAKNKSMLESISIAEDLEVEMESPKEVIVVAPDISSPPEKSMLEVDEVETSKEKDPGIFSIIPTIYYEFDSYEIEEKDKTYLIDLGEYLNNNPDIRLSITSYTDPKGKRAYNKWLSKRRAEKVMEYLMTVGVDQQRLTAVGKGEEAIETNSELASDDFSTSRRTEFAIINTTTAFSEVSTTDANENIAAGETYLSKVYYGFDAYRLNGDSKTEVDQLVDQLKSRSNLQVEIRSHTDARGSEQYNQWLSQKRANEVVRYLVAQGIARNRLTAKGYGETMLINECADGVDCSKEQHLENRRTEFVFK